MFDARDRYLELTARRANGYPQNSNTDSPEWRHWRDFARDLTADAQGKVLDIGAESLTSVSLWPARVDWTGVDPAPSSAGVDRGIAEELPYQDRTFHAVGFLGSLDHILDYRVALDEARRVLRPGGLLIVAGLAWAPGKVSTLLNDHIHWHHFREADYQIMGEGMRLVNAIKAGWKYDAHRWMTGRVWEK